MQATCIYYYFIFTFSLEKNHLLEKMGGGVTIVQKEGFSVI